MKLLSKKATLEVLAGICVNITSGWFGAMFIIPGLFGTTSLPDYIHLCQSKIEMSPPR